MTITIDIRRVLFTSLLGFIGLMTAFISTGCGAYGSNAKSKSTMVVDDGITPVRRVEVTHEGNASGASVGLPIMPAHVGGAGFAGGFGPYGQPVVGGGNLCMVHPDYCGTVVTVMAPAAPQYVGAPSQYGSAPQGNDPAIEGRVTRLEQKSEVNRQVLIRDHQNRKVVVGYLGSALMLNAQSCAHITANPESLIIEDDPELTNQVRAEVLTKCKGILSPKGKN